MESPTSCVSPTSSSGESFAHNMWILLMELLFHEQIGGAFEPFVDEIDLAKIALSCHFGPGCTRLQGRYSRFCMTLHRAPLAVESIDFSVALLPPCDIEILVLWCLEQSQPGFVVLPGMANRSSAWISHCWMLDTMRRSIALWHFLGPPLAATCHYG